MSRRDKEGSAAKEKTTKYFDYTLLFIIIFLVGFGLVMLYSASSYEAQLEFNDAGFYLKKQVFAYALGVAAMFVIAQIDYHVWKKFAGLAYIAAFGLCVFVIFSGDSANGSSRWIRLGPLSFQPSEFAKVAIIIFLATIISKIPKKMANFKDLIKVMIIVLPLVAPVAYTNLSTAIIMVGIAAAMAFVSSPKYSHFIWLVAAVTAFGVIFIMLASYRLDRLKIWLNPEADPAGKGHQTLQGLYAIGSGGLFGKGLGESMQKLGFVPEAQNDMVFSIICEELGLFGAVCLILLFVMMLWRFMVIANNARDLYGALIVVGIMAHISIQVILNIAVVTNTIPNTGITLPFFSYGGTSALFLMAEMGLALSVSRGIKLEV